MQKKVDRTNDGQVVELPLTAVVTCDVCSCCFRRDADKKRHKCITEHNKPVHEQKGPYNAQHVTNDSGAKEDLQSTHAGHECYFGCHFWLAYMIIL